MMTPEQRAALSARADAQRTRGEEIRSALASPKAKRRGNGTKARKRALSMLPETRHFKATGLEVRAQADTDEIIITGSPIVFGVPYQVNDLFGPFTETMHVGVADKVLAHRCDTRFLFNHDGLPLARSTSGTMTLRSTPKALTFEARLDARQQLANDLAIAIGRGDVSQMSVGMIVARDKWGFDPDTDEETRDVYELADLLDVSAVTYPASPTTSVAVAKRMAAELVLGTGDSRARLGLALRELRSGAVLSSKSRNHLVSALSQLHQLGLDGGVDPASIIAADNVGDDASSGGGGDQDPGLSDGTGWSASDRRRAGARVAAAAAIRRKRRPSIKGL